MFGGQKKELTPQEKVTKEWDAMAGEWDDMAQSYAIGLSAVIWQRTGIEDPSNLTVLDFGCGTGLLTERLRTQVGRVIAVDASTKMVEMLREKIKSRGFQNVTACSGILGNLESGQAEFLETMKEFEGCVDLIVCSSVLNFIPQEDLTTTCRALGSLLKPNTGLLFHTDWPSGEGEPADGMNKEKAESIYSLAGLVAESTTVEKLQMGPDQANVFFGLARKS